MNFLKKAVKNVSNAVNTVNNAVQINQLKDDISELEHQKQELEKKKLINKQKMGLNEFLLKLAPSHIDVLRELQNYNIDGVNLAMDAGEFQQRHSGDTTLIYYNKLYHSIMDISQQMKDYNANASSRKDTVEYVEHELEEVTRRLDAMKDKLRKVREKQFGKKSNDKKSDEESEVVVEPMIE